MSDAAYYRTLRDIGEGHITLSVAVDMFDPHTGLPLEEPTIRSVCPDRQPAAGTPDAAGHWWEPLLESGLLGLTERDRWGRQFYQLTEAGIEWLAAHDKEDR